MVRTQLCLKPDDILNAAFGVAQDNPVFSQSFNCQPAWRAFDDRMGPSEIHPLKRFREFPAISAPSRSASLRAR